MDERPIPRPDDRDPEIADAAALFHDSPTRPPSPSAPPPLAAHAGGDYDVTDLADALPVRPVAPLLSEPRAPRAASSAPSMSSRLEPSASVEQVWSRGAEWGATLTLIGVVLLGILFVFYVLFQIEQYSLAFLVLLASAPVLLLVSYPMFITMERPVRVTPEQAVRDFFSALSHHFPHYRRMWLLLSTAGRVSGSFASFDGFRSYWKSRMTELKAGHAGNLTPLKFQVDDFRAEKSAGLTRIDASYTVNVFVRGRQADGPIASTRFTTSLVKGPDRMWYLNSGTFP
jgi:hypothetical protein